MIKAKRMAQILNYISRAGICSYEELSEHFQVSSSTIRRDIDELVRSNAITKTHAGVIAIDAAEQGQLAGAQMNGCFPGTGDRKADIARRASQFVEDNDIIFLGSGMTVACMVPFLKGRRGLYIITNNLLVLNEVRRYSLNAMVVGGNLNNDTMSIVGIQSIRQMQGLNANKAFIGCNGVTLSCSVTNVSEMEADIKKSAMSISDECFLLTESQKFGKMSLHTFASLNDFKAIITDCTPSKEFLDVFQRIDCQLIVSNE